MATTHRLNRALAIIAAAAIASFSAVAGDGPGKGHGNKHEKHAQKQFEKQHKHAEKHARKLERQHARAHFDDDRRHWNVQHPHAAAGCPPGLAKKNNGCLPPGQAKKQIAVGQRLPADVRYYAVPQPVLMQLPAPAPGYRYVRVGNDIVLLSPQSSIVVDVMRGLLG